MSAQDQIRTKPTLPHVNDRAFRLQMRTVGPFPPLSMAAQYAAGAISWAVMRVLLIIPPWHIEERILAWNWGGWVFPWFVITVLPLMLWIPRAQFWLVLNKNGTAVLAHKRWWQRLQDRHIMFELDAAKTAQIELRDGDSWWRSATITIADLHFAPVMQRSAVKRFRIMLANPSGPIPPLY